MRGHPREVSRRVSTHPDFLSLQGADARIQLSEDYVALSLHLETEGP
jgi:hypothetical protein